MVPENCLVNKVIVITGPTAVGKTTISLEIAKALNTEIINCDASQFRKGLNIGTAKINLQETDVIHHLIDFLDPETDFSIKDFQEMARSEISKLLNRKMIPILVGGSGLYINAVLGDYQLHIPERNAAFEKKFLHLNNLELHAYLETLDSKTAALIHPNNRRRVLRAIEAALFNKKISENKSGNKLLYDALIICLNTDRKLLYERINNRVIEMIEFGWLEEVRGLKNSGIDFKKIKEIGYLELANYLEFGGSFPEVLENIQKQTRNYAKRQITWFKNKMNCHFVDLNNQNPGETYNQIKKMIESFYAIKP